MSMSKKINEACKNYSEIEKPKNINKFFKVHLIAIRVHLDI